MVAEIETIRVTQGTTLLVGNLDWRLHDIFDVTGGAAIFVDRLRGKEALERCLLDFIQPCVLKMVTEVKQSDDALLEAYGHVSFATFDDLLLTELGVKAILILFECVVWASTNTDELRSAKRL